jgi:superfamily II DNA helicase RecQ
VNLLDSMAESAKSSSLVADFGAVDVLVCTAAFAMKHSTMLRMEKAMVQDKIIANFCFDEVHCALRNLDFQSEMVKIRTLFRRNVPLIGITGTLHHQLERPLFDILFTSIGLPSEETTKAAGPSYCQSTLVSGAKLTESVDKFVNSRGYNRAVSTVSNHIQYIKINMEHDMDPFMPTALSKLLNFTNSALTELSEVAPDNANRILIVLPRPDLVHMLKSYAEDMFGKENVATLTGGAGSTAAAEFNTQWTRGNAKIGIGTTVVAQCLDNRSCNFVILYALYYGMDTLLQGAARSGRGGQPSTCVFFHSQRALHSKSAREQMTTHRWSSEIAKGIDVSQPDVRRAMSLESMNTFLDDTDRTCRRKRVQREIDGAERVDCEAIVEGRPWCCDICDPDMSQHLEAMWNEADESDDVIAPTSPLRASLAVRSRRVSTSNPYHNSRTTQQRELFQSVVMRNSQPAVSQETRQLQARVRAFLSPDTALKSHCMQKCIWHRKYRAPVHKEDQETVIALSKKEGRYYGSECRLAFWQWMDVPKKDIQNKSCFKCLRDYTVCDKECIQNFRQGVCLKCCVAHSLRGVGGCGNGCRYNDRLKGLVFWALRSPKGHQLVRHQFMSDNTKPDLGQFPDIIRLDLRKDDNNLQWRNAVDWLTSSDQHNFWFWKSIMEAAEMHVNSTPSR